MGEGRDGPIHRFRGWASQGSSPAHPVPEWSTTFRPTRSSETSRLSDSRKVPPTMQTWR